MTRPSLRNIHGPLYDGSARPKYRRTDPPTSRQAWLDNLPRAGTQRRRIYDFLAFRGEHGAICSEVVGITKIKWNSASTRISELIDSGLIESHGTRLGPDGSDQRVVRVKR